MIFVESDKLRVTADMKPDCILFKDTTGYYFVPYTIVANTIGACNWKAEAKIYLNYVPTKASFLPLIRSIDGARVPASLGDYLFDQRNDKTTNKSKQTENQTDV